MNNSSTLIKQNYELRKENIKLKEENATLKKEIKNLTLLFQVQTQEFNNQKNNIKDTLNLKKIE